MQGLLKLILRLALHVTLRLNFWLVTKKWLSADGFLEALFAARTMIDRYINLACVQHYEGRHPKHYLWQEHNRYLYDAISNGDRVLDIGCGASQYPMWLAEKAESVTCVDILPERVSLARKNNVKPNVFYEVMDVTTELPEGKFDVAVLSHVLEHLDDPVGFLKVLAAKVPKIVVKVPSVDTDWMKLVKKDIGLFWMDDHDHRREYTTTSLRSHLEEGGWHIDDLVRGYDLRASATSVSALQVGPVGERAEVG